MIDIIYYKGNKFSYFIINFIIFAPLLIATGILLIMKRKKQCMIAGFLYLIGGLLIWIAKIIYSIILMISRNSGDNSFEDSYQNIFLIVFVINILTIIFRLGASYLIKLMYKPICTLEEYIHEKEHAEFIQSLGQKNSKEDRLVEDEEITEEQIYKKNENPLITGRKKEEDNEDEEINFESS